MELLSFLVAITATVCAARKQRLRQLLEQAAHATFRETFRHDFDPAWGAAVLRYHRHLVDEEREARRLLTNIRRTPGKVREAAGRRDPTSVVSRAMFELICVARGTDAQMKEYSLLDADLGGSSRGIASLRQFVVGQFGEVAARNPDLPPPRGTWMYSQIINDVRVLTEPELVALMVCLDVDSVGLTDADARSNPQGRVKAVLDRERRAMKDARRTAGHAPGTPGAPRPLASRAVEAKKRPILPPAEAYAVPPKSVFAADE